MTEPTKACVRVLKLESAWISLLKYIFITIPFKIGNLIWKGITYISKFINGCIVRSIVRWAGFPISAYLFYLFLESDPKTEYVMGGSCLTVSMVLIGITLLCWMEIPYQEQKILFKME